MQPKKNLGQNFLKDTKVLAKIIKAADLKPTDFVIEIGPGEGALSREIIKYVKNFIMVEKDRNLAEKIARNFQFPISNFQTISNDQKYKFPNNCGVISGDILKINLPELILSYKLKAKSYKLISNIPYYITSPIIKLFLETKYPPQEMILMVQREVAERIVAGPGEMSILAVSVQYYAKAELLFYVDKKSFWPMPEVDSAVIRVTHNMEHITEEERKSFFRIVKAGFAARRKTLLNNLSNSLHISRAETEDKIKKANLDPGARAQELNVEEWKRLTKTISSP